MKYNAYRDNSLKRHSQIRLKPTTNKSNGLPDPIFVVDLYENDKLVETRELPGKNKIYAMDVSDRWDLGLI